MKYDLDASIKRFLFPRIKNATNGEISNESFDTLNTIITFSVCDIIEEYRDQIYFGELSLEYHYGLGNYVWCIYYGDTHIAGNILFCYDNQNDICSIKYKGESIYNVVYKIAKEGIRTINKKESKFEESSEEIKDFLSEFKIAR